MDIIPDEACEAQYASTGTICYGEITAARVILFGPACLGGASFRHIYSEQGVGQTQPCIVLKYWRTRTTQAGRLIRIAVHGAPFAIGTGTSSLKDVSTKLPHMEVRWCASVRQYLQYIGETIELDDPGMPPLQLCPLYSVYIMDMILASGWFQPAQIRQLNYCRLYLQAVTIKANGIHLDLSIYCGRFSP